MVPRWYSVTNCQPYDMFDLLTSQSSNFILVPDSTKASHLTTISQAVYKEILRQQTFNIRSRLHARTDTRTAGKWNASSTVLMAVLTKKNCNCNSNLIHNIQYRSNAVTLNGTDPTTTRSKPSRTRTGQGLGTRTMTQNLRLTKQKKNIEQTKRSKQWQDCQKRK